MSSENHTSFSLTGILRHHPVDPEHAPPDFSKLCDAIELVPPVEVKHAATILKIAYDHWLTKFSYIDPHPNRRNGDKLRLEHALLGGTMDYIQRTGRDTPLDALVSLLETPRALKHVLKRVDYVWRNLHGEAELDDIVIISALRHGPEPVYKFLISNIDAARHTPDAMLPQTTTVKAEWEKVSGSIANSAAVQQLIDLLGIKQLTKGLAVNVTSSCQGVHEEEPTDYFRRIIAEEVGPTELRDQTVLRDIERWQASRDVTPPGKPPPLAVRLEEALPFRRVIDDLLSMNREVQKRRSTCESGKANRT